MSSGAATPSASADGGRPWLVAALLVALPLLPAVATALWHPHRPDWAVLRAPVVEVRQVDLATARGEFPDALWLDAREPGAYAAGHVPDALPMGETEWDNNFAGLMDAWDGERPLVVYCGGESCHASEAVARRLKQDLAFDRIVVLRGGWDAWRAAQGVGGGVAPGVPARAAETEGTR